MTTDPRAEVGEALSDAAQCPQCGHLESQHLRDMCIAALGCLCERPHLYSPPPVQHPHRLRRALQGDGGSLGGWPSMRDHAEVGDTVWWPTDDGWAWRVEAILESTDGLRMLSLRRPDYKIGDWTRVVPEHAVTSNAFLLPA